jgi:CheY-like chemotaxis protein
MDQVSTYHPATTTTAVATAPGPKRGAILVVEDRYDVRSGVVQLLELYGYEVVEAANGEEAVRCLTAAAETFALILLDLLLPGGVSGHDVRAQQLADARAADIPTVVVSACERDADLEAALHPAAWLEKPFHADALLAIVRQHVLPMHPALWDLQHPM